MRTTSPNLAVRWMTTGRPPQVAPNPAFPHGKDLNMARPTAPTCFTTLPYPAPCIGRHVVRCSLCGATCIVTAAGRPDDPRSLTMNCRPVGGYAV